MVFHGFQKMTMLDFPGYVACTVFTPGCNFRCPFCHNSLLVTRMNDSEIYTEDDILSYLKKRQGVIDGICISGGEPLMHDDIFEFVKKVKELGFLVKIDTNGSFPEKLQKLIDSGNIDYVAMDIKNCPEKYPITCGMIFSDAKDFFEPFEQSIQILLEGKVDYEFRTTVVNEFHKPNDIRLAGETIRGARRWFLQCFKDTGDLISDGLSAPSLETLYKMRQIALEFAGTCEIRGV